jgi:hypothetical protein
MLVRAIIWGYPETGKITIPPTIPPIYTGCKRSKMDVFGLKI